MNFSDRYKEELEDMQREEKASEKIADKITSEIMSAEELRAKAFTVMKADANALADTFVSAAEMFYDRLKGKLPYSKITLLVLKFYDKLGGN